MIRIICLAISICIFSTSFAQIGQTKETKKYTSIGKLTNPYKYVELEYTLAENKKEYRLTFKNLEYQELNDIATVYFTANEEELDYLYNSFISMTKLPKNEKKTLSIGNGEFIMESQGMKQVRLYYKENGVPLKYTWLSAKQVKKVFGK
tara:strand:+ start:610 stop:1056 length:447 start_codon:yes stop_codon:yes gene_type:complete